MFIVRSSSITPGSEHTVRDWIISLTFFYGCLTLILALFVCKDDLDPPRWLSSFIESSRLLNGIVTHLFFFVLLLLWPVTLCVRCIKRLTCSFLEPFLESRGTGPGLLDGIKHLTRCFLKPFLRMRETRRSRSMPMCPESGNTQAQPPATKPVEEPVTIALPPPAYSRYPNASD